MSRPLLLVTGQVPPDRVGALQELHAREGLQVALFDGRLHHATAGVADPGVPVVRISSRQAYALAASGRYRAVIASSAGRVALPAAFFGARRSRTPFVYWTGIWHQVATPAHLAGAPLVRWIESRSDAVVAYGPHVADHVRTRGARNVHVAPQAVDVAFWSEPVDGTALRARLGSPSFLLAFAGRDRPGKGLRTAIGAWNQSGVEGAFALAGVEAGRRWEREPGVHPLGVLDATSMRELYAAADAVVIPSEPTRAFREPWALVANEAMLQGTAVIATDSVGAAAGGLIRDGQTGLVVPAGDAAALARAIGRLAEDRQLREGLAGRGRSEAGAFDFAAWSTAVSRALESAGAGQRPC